MASGPTFLFDGPQEARHIVLLGHGAGAAMDSPAMTRIARALSAVGLRVARFEFAYMAARRDGKRRPPPRAEALCPEYEASVAALHEQIGEGRTPIIGGKSMGGRVASLVADRLHAAGRIAGLLCIGYPFHPVGKPEQLRTAHLASLQTPTLIVQGTRDPFGTPEEVSRYALSASVRMLWLEDGDHDLRPRKRLSGHSMDDHLASMASAVAAWSEDELH